jgi:hypothetical protein
MARMMSRIEVSKPPGVSICRTTMRLPFMRAVSIPRVMYREVAGPIAPVISRTVAVEGPMVEATGLATPAAERFKRQREYGQ